MKTKIKLLGIAAMLIIGGTACEKEENLSPSTVQTQQPSSSFTEGSWKISRYELSGVQHDWFANYGLEFKQDGSVIVRGSDPLVKGTWSKREGPKTNYLSLQLGERDPFNMLNHGSWTIVKESATSIELSSRRGDDSVQSMTLTK
jgi:hypothetical protein